MSGRVFFMSRLMVPLRSMASRKAAFECRAAASSLRFALEAARAERSSDWLTPQRGPRWLPSG